VEQSLPVIDHYEQQGKVFKISAVPTPDQVFVEVQKALDAPAQVRGVSSGGSMASRGMGPKPVAWSTVAYL
jgi:hypothetical protein